MTFDTLHQAAAALGLDYDHLATARSCGCRSFRNGRVYTAGLLIWLEANTKTVNSCLNYDVKKLTPARLRKVASLLATIDGPMGPAPAAGPVDAILDGLEGRIVALTPDQARAVVNDLRAKITNRV